MKILLDSHTLIWLYTGNERLSKKAIETIESTQNECFLISQAIIETMNLVSIDEIADLYLEKETVKRIW